MFIISDQLLVRLCFTNCFGPSDNWLRFFGLRGCLALDEDTCGDFRKSHAVQLTAVDYLHPRCTLLQWQPEAGLLALFPGSTVPHLSYIRSSVQKRGGGANELMTGFYPDYRKGKHRPDADTGHDAFRQTRGRPVRRTVDDFDFDSDDRVEFGNPYDNLHAAWSMGVDHDGFASAGCQVVVGFPCCARRGSCGDAGPWARFKANAYERPEPGFDYILLTGTDAQRAAAAGDRELTARLRFGSKGPLVGRVQRVLVERGYYEGHEDGEFGERTLRAVLAFQRVTFGPTAADGIVGPITASALDLDWPRV